MTMQQTHIHLIKLSERMLNAARMGDWDAVASLENDRSRELSAVATDQPDALPLFRTLLTHTEQVRELASRQRERLGEDLGQHQHRHRALSAYLQAGID